MTDLAAIRERHVRVTKPTMEPDPADPTRVRQTAYCQWCATRRPDDDPRWPCETNQLLALLADTPSVEPAPPYRRDLAETLCFLDHRHDEPSCPKGRHEADRIYRALEARYAHRALLPTQASDAPEKP